jgi:hypothetical protein
MRRAAVQEQVFDRAEETDDEVEIRRGAGEEAGGDAPRDRARRRVLWRCGPGEQRARKRVRQGIDVRRRASSAGRP